MSKTEYLSMASSTVWETRGTGGAGVGRDWVGEKGCLDPTRIDNSLKGGTMDGTGTGVTHGFAVDWQYRLSFYACVTLLPYAWVTPLFWPFVISVTLLGHCGTKMWWMAGLLRMLQPSYLCDTVLTAVAGVLASIGGARLGGTSIRTIWISFCSI